MPPKRKPSVPNAALAETIAADREAEGEPFRGFAGELPAPERSAVAPPPPPFVIPPPPWAVAQAHPDDPDRDPDRPEESAA